MLRRRLEMTNDFKTSTNWRDTGAKSPWWGEGSSYWDLFLPEVVLQTARLWGELHFSLSATEGPEWPPESRVCFRIPHLKVKHLQQRGASDVFVVHLKSRSDVSWELGASHQHTAALWLKHAPRLLWDPSFLLSSPLSALAQMFISH